MTQFLESCQEELSGAASQLAPGALSAYTLGGGAWGSYGAVLQCHMRRDPAVFCCLLFLSLQLQRAWARTALVSADKAPLEAWLSRGWVMGLEGREELIKEHVEAYFCIIPNAVYNW